MLCVLFFVVVLTLTNKHIPVFLALFQRRIKALMSGMSATGLQEVRALVYITVQLRKYKLSIVQLMTEGYNTAE